MHCGRNGDTGPRPVGRRVRRRHRVRRALLRRRPRAVRAAALLRLHGARVRLVADDGHVRQCDQQAGGRSAVRVRGRVDRRSVRPAPADDGRHPDGGRRAGRPRRDVRAPWTFYFFYFFNALGYVCGGPLPCQVLLSRWFDKTRGKAMGIAYLGIGIGGALVPLLSQLARRRSSAGAGRCRRSAC